MAFQHKELIGIYSTSDLRFQIKRRPLFIRIEGYQHQKPKEMPSTLQLQRIKPLIPTTTAAAISTSDTTVNFLKHSLSHNITRHLSLSPTTSIPADTLFSFHSHSLGPNQCSSAVIQSISAPVPIVWSLVRRFDNPQAYKHFLKSCHIILGDGLQIGTLREVRVVSGLPASSSTERLEILDDEHHIISFSVVGGEHRLQNYRSVTTLHPTMDGEGTVVVESYVVDIPPGNTKEETCVFADMIVKCNLQWLAKIAEKMAKTRL
ncbi:Abscisic acid receptor pyl4 [Ancistrocladus abbreviatus]